VFVSCILLQLLTSDTSHSTFQRVMHWSVEFGHSPWCCADQLSSAGTIAAVPSLASNIAVGRQSMPYSFYLLSTELTVFVWLAVCHWRHTGGAVRREWLFGERVSQLRRGECVLLLVRATPWVETNRQASKVLLSVSIPSYIRRWTSRLQTVWCSVHCSLHA